MHRFKFTFAGVAVAVALLVLLAACGDSATPETVDTPGDGDEPAAPRPTSFDLPFGGARDRVDVIVDPARIVASTVQQVEAFDDGPFDRIEFTFDESVPDYTIEYVDAAFACGSGLPVDVAGTAILEIRMQPAAAHDEAGVETIASADMLFDFPTLLQLTMTCDFEGEVVWVAGLSEEVNFKNSFLTAPFAVHAIIIDLNHPGRD